MDARRGQTIPDLNGCNRVGVNFLENGILRRHVGRQVCPIRIDGVCPSFKTLS